VSIIIAFQTIHPLAKLSALMAANLILLLSAVLGCSANPDRVRNWVFSARSCRDRQCWSIYGDKVGRENWGRYPTIEKRKAALVRDLGHHHSFPDCHYGCSVHGVDLHLESLPNIKNKNG
jgi:hypothetical protein